MKIILYHFSGEDVTVTKTDSLEEIIELEGTLREATSIENPTITLNLDAKEIEGFQAVTDDEGNTVTDDDGTIVGTATASHQILLANYAYIPAFERYYYITERTSYSLHMWRLTMKEDVLFSNDADIRNQSAMIDRCASAYNTDIEDSLASSQYDRISDEYEITNTATDATEFNGYKTNDETTGVEVVNIALTTYLNNDDHSTQSHVSDELARTPHWMGEGLIPAVTPSYYGSSVSKTITYTMDKSDWKMASGLIFSNDDVASFVVSAQVYPYELHRYTGWSEGVTVVAGNTSLLSGTRAMPNLYKNIDIFRNASFTITRKFGDWRDYEPYSQYEIYIPYLDWKSFPSYLILNRQLSLWYVVDMADGGATALLIDDTTSKIIFSGSCQLGVKLPISSSNIKEVNDTRLSAGLNMGINLIGSGLAVAGGVATGNPLAVAGGAMKATSAIASGVTTLMTTYEKGNCQVGSGTEGLFLPQKARVRITSVQSVGYDDAFLALCGKPLREVRKLNTLSGYTKIADCHLQGFGTCTDGEKAEILSLLKSGVIL